LSDLGEQGENGNIGFATQSRESNGVRNKKSKNLLAWTRNTHNQEGKEKHSKNKQQIKFLSNRWGGCLDEEKRGKKSHAARMLRKNNNNNNNRGCCLLFPVYEKEKREFPSVSSRSHGKVRLTSKDVLSVYGHNRPFFFLSVGFCTRLPQSFFFS
jgi:hypothetical protein